MSSPRSAAVLLAAVLGCAATPEILPAPVSDGRYVMGTVLELSLFAADEAEARETLAALFEEAERLEALLSTWQPDSDVSRINREAGRGAQDVAPEVGVLLRRSIEYAQTTGGSFDVTVGPLVALWTQAAQRDVLPTKEAIDRARKSVGSRHLRVSGDDRVEIVSPGVSIDLGGIAKGYALDRMRPLLAARGVERALLNFGQSSTWAIGAPPGLPGWRLLVRGPGDSLLGVITLRDQALSVSGSLGQFTRIGGREFGHILDPRTGWPLTARRQSVVVAADATLAEALSKALLVLEPEEGVALVTSQPGCEGLLVDADGQRWETPGFAASTAWEPLTAP